MPRYRITVEWDDEEHTEMVDRDNQEEAEWAAADHLRDMVYSRTSTRAELIETADQ